MADPVTLAEARIHLRLPTSIDTDEQDEITRIISAATEYAENYTNRLWTTGNRTEYFDAFPISTDRTRLGLYLPSAKGGITISSVTYYDDNYQQQTLASNLYRVVGATDRAYLFPAMGEVWPTDLSNEPKHIAVTYAIDGTVSVPQSVKQAILLLVGALYEYREDGVIDNAGLALVKAPKAAEDLLNPYRIRLA
jgi:uncharacterized phiE125 gp8 family phage protein